MKSAAVPKVVFVERIPGVTAPPYECRVCGDTVAEGTGIIFVPQLEDWGGNEYSVPSEPAMFVSNCPICDAPVVIRLTDESHPSNVH